MKAALQKLLKSPTQPADLLLHLTTRRNARRLSRLGLALVGMVAVYAVAFHLFMGLEGKSYPWLTGIYWTLTTMTTLGLGDIVFDSGLGQAFTGIVLVSGVLYLLVILPFVFIQLSTVSARVPVELAPRVKDHVVIVHYGPLAMTLIERLRRQHHSYALVLDSMEEALTLHEQHHRVVYGSVTDPQTYREARVRDARFVVATGPDVTTASVVYAIREASPEVPIAATASNAASAAVLRASGATHILTLDELLGNAMARRTIAGDAIAHVIGQMGDLTIAEATASGTPLEDKTVGELRLRELTGVHLVGVWEQGTFHIATPATRLTRRTVLVLAGSQEQVDRYNELFCIYNLGSAPLLILGGGNVGRVVAQAFTARGLDYLVIDRHHPPGIDSSRLILGDATVQETLEDAGLAQAPAAVITTHEDDVNIFLTTLVRHLRPDIQIVARATMERSVRTLHRAGCDFVLSSASMGASITQNLLLHGNILMLEEGVDMFRVGLPSDLAGKRIRDTAVRRLTGATIVAVSIDEKTVINPDPDSVLPPGAEIILVGTVEAENAFFERFGPGERIWSG
jgi:voltage-gated potassium channel